MSAILWAVGAWDGYVIDAPNRHRGSTVLPIVDLAHGLGKVLTYEDEWLLSLELEPIFNAFRTPGADVDRGDRVSILALEGDVLVD